MPDLLEQLADLEVPPPPAQFDTQLHDRVNRSLVTWQLVDLVVNAFPQAILEFARALVGLTVFSVTGRHEPKGNKRRHR